VCPSGVGWKNGANCGWVVLGLLRFKGPSVTAVDVVAIELEIGLYSEEWGNDDVRVA